MSAPDTTAEQWRQAVEQWRQLRADNRRALRASLSIAGVLAVALIALIALQIGDADRRNWPVVIAAGVGVLVLGGLAWLLVAALRRLGRVQVVKLPSTSCTSEDDEEDPRWSAVKALVTAGVVSGAVLALTVGLLVLLRGEDGESNPEEALSLVFVAAAVVLILVVCTLTIVLKRLKLVDKQEAMGLPRGSIRAVIALMLVLLFFIAAIFLFNTTRRVPPTGPELRVIQGLTEDRFQAIPLDQVDESVRDVQADGTALYTVTLLPSPLQNQTSDDLAKQLITVLGTLVTAVAAFYFGANSVSAALKGHAEFEAARRKAEPGKDSRNAESRKANEPDQGQARGQGQTDGTP